MRPASAIFLQSQMDVLRRLRRRSLYYFARACFDVLHRGDGARFVEGWHIEAICHALEQIEAGVDRRLIITVPPRHLKSICSSVAFVAWLLGRNPGAKIIVASYGDALAVEHSRATRVVMESDFYRELFPDTELQIAKHLELQTTLGGYRKAVTVGGAITGLGADHIIIDDPMKAADAPSEVERERVKAFYSETLVSRLNNQRTGTITLVQQRLHEDDLAGHLIGMGGFRHLNLPAIAEEEHLIPIAPGQIHTRRVGDLLFPGMLPQGELERIRTEMGATAFSAQYQQNPTAPGGNRIRWEWFPVYVPGSFERANYGNVVISWDTGMTGEPTSDCSVGTVWGSVDRNWHLLHVERVRLDFPDLKRRVASLTARYRADRVLIEKAGTGFALLQQLRQDRDLPFVYLGRTPRHGKEERVEAITGQIETGRYCLPETAPWLSTLRAELLGFPNSRHDDQVDSLVQFVEWENSSRGRGIEDRDPVSGRPIGKIGRHRARG